MYRKAWKQYVKFRHLLNSKPKIMAADKMKLKDQEEKLREIRMKKTMKREVFITLSLCCLRYAYRKSMSIHFSYYSYSSTSGQKHPSQPREKNGYLTTFIAGQGKVARCDMNYVAFLLLAGQGKYRK